MDVVAIKSTCVTIQPIVVEDTHEIEEQPIEIPKSTNVEDNLIEAMVTFYERDVVENMNQVKE